MEEEKNSQTDYRYLRFNSAYAAAPTRRCRAETRWRFAVNKPEDIVVEKPSREFSCLMQKHCDNSRDTAEIRSHTRNSIRINAAKLTESHLDRRSSFSRVI
jgi:hypothetical protein